MSYLERKVKQVLGNVGFNFKTQSIVVGVSGGVDSMVLVNVLHKLGVKVSIAHCNFGLRKEATGDEQFVQTFAEKLNIPFYVISFNTKMVAEKQKISIQMAARTLRYDWFSKIIQSGNYDYVSVGTNLNDQIETSIFNLTMGCGISGLHGIAELNDSNVLRPLVWVSKHDIEQYANLNEIDFRQDKSNQSTKYHRNRIRHNVIPELNEINNGLLDSYSRSIKIFSDTEKVLKSRVEELRKLCVSTNGNDAIVQLKSIKESEAPKLLLFELLRDYGFNGNQVDDILTSIKTGSQYFANNYCAILNRGELIITEKLSQDESIYKVDLFESKTLPVPFKNLIEIHEAGKVNYRLGDRAGFFRANLIKEDVTFRIWQPGDKIAPLGMNGYKKVSDLLIDLKVPKHKKRSVYVMEVKGEIAWVVGYKVSENFKVVNNESAVQITLL